MQLLLKSNGYRVDPEGDKEDNKQIIMIIQNLINNNKRKKIHNSKIKNQMNKMKKIFKNT